MTDAVPLVPLNSGTSIPQLGFGTFKVDPGATQAAVEQALAIGYRHIDTATGYNNETEVGAAVAASGVKREELFITTKLRNDHHKAGDFEGAFGRSLEMLGLDYVDLYMIHWPLPGREMYVKAWEAFIGFHAAGLAKAIGVCNFTEANLDRVIAETGVTPAVNQVELHPIFQQVPLRAYHALHGIATEAWGPLGQSRFPLDSLEPVAQAAAAHAVTPAQVILRWHLQEGVIAIPKATQRVHAEQNFDLFGFELSPSEMAAIRALDTNQRLGGDPGRND
jgi:2,5-diketo-D-gluconate reductase A